MSIMRLKLTVGLESSLVRLAVINSARDAAQPPWLGGSRLIGAKRKSPHE